MVCILRKHGIMKPQHMLNSKPIRLAVTLLVRMTLHVPFTLSAGTNTYTVCASGCDLTTIQAALDDERVTASATTQAGDVEVYTINSHHAGVPEVAFLVKVDGYTIYHNGHYRAEYVEDYEYLATITDHIDIAFVIGHPFVDHPYFQQAVRLNEVFHPTYMFAINREGEEFKCRQFAELLAEHGIEVNVISGERRGDSFVCPRSSGE